MLNSTIIQGRLTANPELHTTQNGISVTTFTVAVERPAKRGTDFIDVVAWRSTAEFICSHFTKGNMILVDGRLQVRNWTAADGTNRKNAEVVVNSVNFAEYKSRPAASATEEGSTPAPADMPADAPTPEASEPPVEPAEEPSPF